MHPTHTVRMKASDGGAIYLRVTARNEGQACRRVLARRDVQGWIFGVFRDGFSLASVGAKQGHGMYYGDGQNRKGWK